MRIREKNSLKCSAVQFKDKILVMLRSQLLYYHLPEDRFPNLHTKHLRYCTDFLAMFEQMFSLAKETRFPRDKG
jgi:hypothetical protein